MAHVDCASCGHKHQVAKCSRCNCGTLFNGIPPIVVAESDRIAQLESDLARVQAEAATMRRAIERDHDKCCAKKKAGIGCLWCEALRNNAGLALAERVPLWRELHRLVSDLSRGVIMSREVLDVLRRLAALDEKGGV